MSGLGPEFVFLSAMFALNPDKVDAQYLMQYTDSRVQIGQQLDTLAKRMFTKEQLEYAGVAGYIAHLAINRQVTFTYRF